VAECQRTGAGQAVDVGAALPVAHGRATGLDQRDRQAARVGTGGGFSLALAFEQVVGGFGGSGCRGVGEPDTLVVRHGRGPFTENDLQSTRFA
jgi:hypothetical protein